MKAKKALKRARQAVDDRLDAATQHRGVGHSVFTVEAVVELIADVLQDKA